MLKDLVKIREQLLAIEPHEEPQPLLKVWNSPNRLVNMRFDIEVPFDTPWPKAVDILMDQLNLDLMDVVVNGDVDERNDPLMKSFDGLKKRKVYQPKKMEIAQFQLFREYSPKRNQWEFTIYVIPYIDFKEANA